MILERIVSVSGDRVRERMRAVPLGRIERAARDAPPPRGFAGALRRASGRIGLIAELKKASPSAGVLRADFDVTALARAMVEGGADCLSVLTEVDHFQGGLGNLEIAAETGAPLLQKDFVVTEYQVLEGRSRGADAVLLIAEALLPARARGLSDLALDLGMDVVYEAHEPANVRRAATLAEREPEHVLVGVNNRDLRTFTTDLDVTLRALRELPRGLLVVAESGIAAAADVRRLRDAGAAGVLVGEHIMRQSDVAAACRALLSDVRA